MTPISPALAKRSLPLIVFATLIAILCLTAVLSFGDLVSSRLTLASEVEFLEKLKERSAKTDRKHDFVSTDYLFEFPSHGLAAAEFQRRISETLNANGADLQLSEVIPPDPDGDVGRLAIAINFEIDDQRLIELLHAIENTKPAFLIERLSLRILTAGNTGKARRLQATATIVAGWRPAQ